MAINLIKILKDQAGDMLVDQASTLFNESPSHTKSAVDAIIPSLMGAVVQKGTSKSGAEELMGMLTKGQFDGGLLDNIGDMMGGGGNQLDDLLKQGGGLLSSLVGDHKRSGLIDMIADYAGVKKQSSSSLLSLAAPLIMSLIGKQVRKNGLDIGGLINMLAGQTDHVKSALPPKLSGIGNLLGFSGELGNLGGTAESVEETAEAATSGSTNWLPWVLGAAVLIAIIYFMTGRGDDTQQAITETADEVSESVQDVAEDAQETMAQMESSAVMIGQDIREFLSGDRNWEDYTFQFAMADFETGSAALSERMNLELAGLAEVMKANPSMKVHLTAYSANEQDLAIQRALAIKNQLTNDEGIASDRITTAGAVAESGDENRAELTITDM